VIGSSVNLDRPCWFGTQSICNGGQHLSRRSLCTTFVNQSERGKAWALLCDCPVTTIKSNKTTMQSVRAWTKYDEYEIISCLAWRAAGLSRTTVVFILRNMILLSGAILGYRNRKGTVSDAIGISAFFSCFKLVPHAAGANIPSNNGSEIRMT